MRNIFLTITSIILLVSCGNKSSNQKILLDSTGKVNTISVVLGNDMWEGRVGEAIRNVLAQPIYGLPQDEPMFSINQIPSNVFSDFITKNRTILKIEMGKALGTAFVNNVYAKPQKVIVVSGKTKQDIINQLRKNASKIVKAFKGIEILEKQRLIRKSLYNDKVIQEKLGLSIQFPTAYRIAKDDNTFFWIRRDINTGTLNLMIYELPYNALKRNDSIVNQIVKLRDSIGKAHIEGPTKNAYMITEKAYAPFYSETIIDNKPTLETKGIWDVKNAFMSGPFINYAIEDKINNRWVVVEGFAFAPSVEKRNYVFELESIIKSIKIN